MLGILILLNIFLSWEINLNFKFLGVSFFSNFFRVVTNIFLSMANLISLLRQYLSISILFLLDVLDVRRSFHPGFPECELFLLLCKLLWLFHLLFRCGSFPYLGDFLINGKSLPRDVRWLYCRSQAPALCVAPSSPVLCSINSHCLGLL